MPAVKWPRPGSVEDVPLEEDGESGSDDDDMLEDGSREASMMETTHFSC